MKINELIEETILLERHEDIVQSLQKYKDRDDIFISYSDVPKLGIYPRTSWFTPAGIYCYPLKEMFVAIQKNKVPFAGSRKYVIVIQQKPGKNILELSTMTDEQWQNDLSKIKIIWKRLFPDEQNIDEKINAIISNRRQNPPGAYFWAVVESLSLHWSEELGKKRTVAGNIILRELGYDGITDKAGNGIIHGNEPTQAVFLKADVVNLIEILYNKRKEKFPTDKHTDEELAAIISENPSTIRVIKNPPEWLQLIAVKQKNGDSIKWIKNPSEQVQLTAVRSSPFSLGMILKNKIIPSEKVQIAAIMKYDITPISELVRYGVNISDAVIDIMLKKSLRSFIYILKSKKLPSEKAQIAAMKYDGSMIHAYFENGFVPSEAVQIAAVKDDKVALYYIIDAGIIPSIKVQKIAIKEHYRAVDYIIGSSLFSNQHKLKIANYTIKLYPSVSPRVVVALIRNDIIPPENLQIMAVKK